MVENEILDISDWQIHKFYNTKGTREKWILDDKNGIRYFFKKSKEQAGYIHEFWSEIIAYHLGVMLDFPVLRYQVAILNSHIGCLSKSLIGAEEYLVEGLQLLQAYDPSFHVFTNEGKAKYSYHLIESTLKSLGWSLYMEQILQTIVFDSIIGNQDRHQENWGFTVRINRNSPTIKNVADILNLNQKGYAYSRQGFSEYSAYTNITFSVAERYTPIYDSGSSLGRELTSQKITALLNDSKQLLAYIKRGKSEIRWRSSKVSHFELVKILYNESGYIWIDDIVKQAVQNYNENRLYAILDALDQDVPEPFLEYKLSYERKMLILQMTTLRISYLSNLL